MKELNKYLDYYLGDLSKEEREEIYKTTKNYKVLGEFWNYITFQKGRWVVGNKPREAVNLKRVFNCFEELKDMENLIGKKVIGFKFEDNYNIFFDERMNNYIGQVGEIDAVYDSNVDVRFEDGQIWVYPLDLIKNYLIEEQQELVEEESKSGWYKDSDIPKWLCYRDYENDRIYGFNLNNVWFCDTEHKHEKELNLYKEYRASNEEVLQRLTEEAKRRGLVVGKKIKCLVDGQFWNPSTGDYFISKDGNGSFLFVLDSAVLLKNGVWTEAKEEDKLENLFEVEEIKKDLEESQVEEQTEIEHLPEIKEQFYFNQSKHGPNFYRILETIQVKNEYHDWRDYYKYEQLGSGKIFHKPVDMFEKEFKKVEIG